MIVVAGATGNVGGALVRELVDAGEEVRALTRDPARTRLPDGATAVASDLNRPASLADALGGASAVFLLSGYADMPGLLAEVRRAGVARTVLLSGSAAEVGDRGNAVSRYMMDSEEAVRSADVPWTILRPRSFMTNTLQWLPQLRAGDVVRAPWPGVAVAAVDPVDIAAVAAAALRTADHEGRTYPVTGPEPLRPAERVRVLAEVLERDLRYEPQPDEEARAEMRATMPAEYVDAFFQFFSAGALDESAVHPTVAQVTGHPPRTFRQWVRAHAEELG